MTYQTHKNLQFWHLNKSKKILLFFLALSANNSSCRARALLISDYDCVMHNEIAPLLLLLLLWIKGKA